MSPLRVIRCGIDTHGVYNRCTVFRGQGAHCFKDARGFKATLWGEHGGLGVCVKTTNDKRGRIRKDELSTIELSTYGMYGTEVIKLAAPPQLTVAVRYKKIV